jgi:hypothetical protein
MRRISCVLVALLALSCATDVGTGAGLDAVRGCRTVGHVGTARVDYCPR